MKLTIEVDALDEYELAEPKPRQAKHGESYLYPDYIGTFRVVQCLNNSETNGKYFIVRKKWTPPASCPKGATFKKNGNGAWLVVVNQSPYIVSNIYADFTPPPRSPYTVE